MSGAQRSSGMMALEDGVSRTGAPRTALSGATFRQIADRTGGLPVRPCVPVEARRLIAACRAAWVANASCLFPSFHLRQWATKMKYFVAETIRRFAARG